MKPRCTIIEAEMHCHCRQEERTLKTTCYRVSCLVVTRLYMFNDRIKPPQSEATAGQLSEQSIVLVPCPLILASTGSRTQSIVCYIQFKISTTNQNCRDIPSHHLSDAHHLASAHLHVMHFTQALRSTQSFNSLSTRPIRGLHPVHYRGV